MIAYKLFRIKKNGDITSLFINKKVALETGVWMYAKPHPTKGYKFRPFWHCMKKPEAPHLSMKGRKWFKVQIFEYEKFERPKSQGGVWYIAQMMMILEEVKDEEI